MQEIVRLRSGLTLYYHITGTHKPDKVLHRIDGPAVSREYSPHERWYYKGQIHRTDGPAVTREDGTVSWYLHDKPYPFEEWAKLVDLSQEKFLELLLKYG